LPGELYVNWPDAQLGAINSGGNAQDLIAVRFFSSTTNYVTGDHVAQGGFIYRAKAAVPAGAFNATQWDQIATATSLAGSYLLLTGGTLTGPLTLAADPAAALQPATKQYVDTPVASLWSNIRYRNRIINGDMSVDQRGNGGAMPTAALTIIDRWKFGNVAGTASKGNIARAGPYPSVPFTGFPFLYALGATVTSAYPTPVANDAINITQTIEGINFLDAQWGTPQAQPVVLEFWAAATPAGTYSLSLANNAGTRSYVATFTLAANTWTKIRLNIPGDTAGTWAVAESAAMLVVRFPFCLGTNFTTATLNTWVAGNFVGATGATNVLASTSNNFNLTGVALMVGAAAANAEPEFKSYSANLLDCQRYFQSGEQLVSVAYQTAGQPLQASASLPVRMRTSPTAAITSNSSNNITGITLTATSAAVWNGAGSVTATGTAVLSIVFSVDADF
jgi:hypothetical protein